MNANKMTIVWMSVGVLFVFGVGAWGKPTPLRVHTSRPATPQQTRPVTPQQSRPYGSAQAPQPYGTYSGGWVETPNWGRGVQQQYMPPPPPPPQHGSHQHGPHHGPRPDPWQSPGGWGAPPPPPPRSGHVTVTRNWVVVGDFVSGGDAKEVVFGQGANECVIEVVQGSVGFNTVVLRRGAKKQSVTISAKYTPGALIPLPIDREVTGVRVSDTAGGRYRVKIR